MLFAASSATLSLEHHMNYLVNKVGMQQLPQPVAPHMPQMWSICTKLVHVYVESDRNTIPTFGFEILPWRSSVSLSYK